METYTHILYIHDWIQAIKQINYQSYCYWNLRRQSMTGERGSIPISQFKANFPRTTRSCKSTCKCQNCSMTTRASCTSSIRHAVVNNCHFVHEPTEVETFAWTDWREKWRTNALCMRCESSWFSFSFSPLSTPGSRDCSHVMSIPLHLPHMPRV